MVKWEVKIFAIDWLVVELFVVRTGAKKEHQVELANEQSHPQMPI